MDYCWHKLWFEWPNLAIHAKVMQPSGKILQVASLSLSFQSWRLLIFSSTQKANRVHLNELFLNWVLSFCGLKNEKLTSGLLAAERIMCWIPSDAYTTKMNYCGHKFWFQWPQSSCTCQGHATVRQNIASSKP